MEILDETVKTRILAIAAKSVPIAILGCVCEIKALLENICRNKCISSFEQKR
jgi:hypothetical protein